MVGLSSITLFEVLDLVLVVEYEGFGFLRGFKGSYLQSLKVFEGKFPMFVEFK